LGLAVYDLGARLYDPAIGRFMIQDPLADFVNYQSPYVFADNNPILYVDEYGFGIFRAIGNIFSRIGFGIKKLVSGGSCNCSQFQGESLRDAWNQPDFPGLNNFVSDLFSGSGRNSSNSSSSSSDRSTNNIDNKRDPISAIDLPGSSGISSDNSISFNTSKLDNTFNPRDSSEKDNPRRTPPTFNGKKIKANTTISLNISYVKSRFLIEPTDTNKKIVNDLIKTLKEYPDLKLILSANMDVDDSDSSLILTGEGRMSVSNFKKGRAKSILKILTDNGISKSRVQSKIGNSNSMSVDVKFK
jgi:hypothetical protein